MKLNRLICLWFLLAMPLVAETVRLYVTNSGDTTVEVIDPLARKVVQVIDGTAGIQPLGELRIVDLAEACLGGDKAEQPLVVGE